MQSAAYVGGRNPKAEPAFFKFNSAFYLTAVYDKIN